VFSPFMRAHSAGDTREREPWSFGEPFTSINRKFIELRYRLMPYFYSAFWEHNRYGFPILRPMVMQEQEVAINHFRQDEFTFGDKILVCPVMDPGVKTRTVYLPKGDWYHYWTHEKLVGGTEIVVETPLDSMPIFVKAGSVIPESPVMQYVGEKQIEELLFQVYYAAYEVNSFFFEDYGETFAYEQDIYLEKKFVTTGDEHSMTITQSVEGLYTPRYENYEMKIIGLPFKPSKVLVDNKQIIKTTIDELERYRFKANKNFRMIQIFK